MSFASLPLQQPSISRAFHEQLLQIIKQLMEQMQVAPQLGQILLQYLQQNEALIREMHGFLYTQLRQQKGVDLSIPNTSVHPGDVWTILHPWIVQKLQVLSQQLQSQGGMQMGGGFGTPMVGNFGGPMLAQPSSGSIYSIGATAPSAPVAPPPPSPATMPSQPQPFKPVSPPTPSRKDAPPMTIEKLSFVNEAIDDEHALGREHGIEVIKTPKVSQWNATPVIFANLRLHRDAVSAFDAYRQLYMLFPGGMKRGYWTYRVIYTEISHLAMATDEFLEVREQVRTRFKQQKWRGILEALQDTKQGTWDKINILLTDRLNMLLAMRVRDPSNFNLRLSIQSVRDLVELTDPHLQSDLATHPNFATTIEDLLNRVISEIFIQDTALTQEKPHMSALLRCREVDYFKDNVSKYDYGTLEPAERDNLIRALFANNTVFRFTRSLVATNVLPDESVQYLNMADARVDPAAQGLYAQMQEFILRGDIAEPKPEAIVLCRYRIPPRDWLNIVQPIYPMGGEDMVLVGGTHVLGW